ncbi:tRNA (adenosine(37)-N6)-threonylcarbamoyltransferase complex dimerization subunit type 1 TsaB [Paenibacillus sp. DXFW5]|uniref:tRNA (Adenosine(37)-N6)-threonylcarbamoyltransferase complex dimerization subunit type 1 TsaB n=1 Tax=Paenibacillus rhizolycopersici TaxID=2780073 RepID=A0ABS2GZK2_9BACL|nr:tRNA (adenosine(37)-N6)-threonylcarbamoyltransferase complex dimerization subunit type 1 TsaB [Paenibacillus rhizolycopersici]MBM6994347.1 tRNA (adenosine(37)-N6)-threonylcarbamoyltransferase complex dimerization subunit type 1 TsaB [Paenibacillus rhizolycopersici]
MNEYENIRPPQRLLAFDTATSSLAVAVTEGGRVLAERNIHAERNHSAYLVTAIGDCLEAAGLAKQDLDGIAVGIGPGSYTGIRIAVTTAKTLAWSLRLPVYGVSSLAALALGGWAGSSGQDAAALGELAARRGEEGRRATAGGHWIAPLIDARRGQAYTALFGVTAPGGLPERLEPDAIRLMDGWADELQRQLEQLPPDERPARLWFVGETEKHEAAIAPLIAAFGELVQLVPYELEGAWMGIAGLARSWLPADEVHALEPNYTQLAEAEAKRLRNA